MKKSFLKAMQNTLNELFSLSRHALQQSPRYRKLLLSSLAIYGLTVFLIINVINNHGEEQQRLHKHHSQILSQMIGQQLKIPMSNQNLVSMQATLKELVNQTQALSGIIYDVNNRIIVQAGELQSIKADRYQAYTTAITLDNALLGSLTLYISKPEASINGLITCTFILVSLLWGLAFFYMTQQQRTITKQPALVKQPTIEAPPEPHRIALFVYFHNLDKLKQQLSATIRLQEFENLEKIIKKISLLYSAKSSHISADGIILLFDKQDEDSVIFDALCSAHLLMQYNLNKPSLLLFSTIIDKFKDNATIKDVHQIRSLLQCASGQLIIHKHNLSTTLQSRLNYQNSSDPDYLLINGFRDSYAKLLNKQLTHLIEQNQTT